MEFTGFDICVAIISTLSLLTGLYSGLIKSLMNLLGLLLTGMIFYFFTPQIFGLMQEIINHRLAAGVIFFIASFIILIITSWTVNFVGKKIFFFISGGIIDHILGLGIGALRALLINMLIFTTLIIVLNNDLLLIDEPNELDLTVQNEEYAGWFKNSQSYPYFANIYNMYVKDHLKNILENSVDAHKPQEQEEPETKIMKRIEV